MNEKQPTIHDVAREANVSIATVSRVLSGGSASEASRRKVRAAMEQLNYRPGSIRAARRSDSQRCIAAVLSPQTSPYYAAMCEGITAEAARNGYKVLVLSYPEGTSCETVTADLMELQPAGTLLAGFAVESSISQDVTRACLQRIQQAMPLVAIGPPIEGIECARLTSDPSQCVRKAMAHLAMLGHRRIAFVGGDRGARFSVIREGAYYEEAERLGCVRDPRYVMITGCNSQGGELGVSILLGNLQRTEYPTAIFAINDLTALGALRELQRSGLKVPDDIALVGCDNAFFAPYLSPSLTTVDLHPVEHGRAAVAELIMSINAGHPISFNQTFESSLIVRESCGAALGVRHFEK